jgi:hypothetical protein
VIAGERTNAATNLSSWVTVIVMSGSDGWPQLSLAFVAALTAPPATRKAS